MAMITSRSPPSEWSSPASPEVIVSNCLTVTRPTGGRCRLESVLAEAHQRFGPGS